MAVTTLALALSIGLQVGSTTGTGATTSLPDTDRERLAYDFSFYDPPAVETSSGDALETVAKYYDVGVLGARTDVYLESVTIHGTQNMVEPVVERAVWIVRLTDFEVVRRGPVGRDGSTDDSATVYLHRAYVLVDADTSEFIMTVWQQ